MIYESERQKDMEMSTDSYTLRHLTQFLTELNEVNAEVISLHRSREVCLRRFPVSLSPNGWHNNLIVALVQDREQDAMAHIPPETLLGDSL